MADQHLAAKKSKKKDGGMVKLFRNLATSNDSASRLNSTQISVSSASGAHDYVLGNGAGSAEPMASSKYIDSILVLSDN